MEEVKEVKKVSIDKLTSALNTIKDYCTQYVSCENCALYQGYKQCPLSTSNYGVYPSDWVIRTISKPAIIVE